MPITSDQWIGANEEPRAQVALEPVFNVFNSLMLLIKSEKVYGFNEWVYNTAQRLNEKLKWNHRIIFDGLNYAISPEKSLPSFPDYIRSLASANPLQLREKLFGMYLRVDCRRSKESGCYLDTPDDIDPESVLGNADDYLNFLGERFGREHVDVEVERAAYQLVKDPPAMQKFIVAHLWNIWEEVMAEEWRKVEPVLSETVSAFQKLDLSGKTIPETAEMILDVDQGGSDYEKIKRKLGNVSKITFIPSAHIGPYHYQYGFRETKWLVFGVHSPRGMAVETPELKRAEVLVRLNALADETRLKILQLIASTGTMNSTEIMIHLGLSQSAASRHLQQLNATGYLNASWEQGAKQYTLNPQRIEETLQAIAVMLLKK